MSECEYLVLGAANVQEFERMVGEKEWYCWGCCKRKKTAFFYETTPVEISTRSPLIVASNDSCVEYAHAYAMPCLEQDEIEIQFVHNVRDIFR